MNRSDAGKKGYEKAKHAFDSFRDEKTRQAIEKYEANPSFCKECGVLIPFEKRRNTFCSRSCSQTYNNRGAPRNIKHSKLCQCGKPKSTQNLYCDECAGNHVYRKVTRLEDAKEDRVRKRILIEMRGRRCESCGLSEWLGDPIAIALHHVDGDSDNNTPENLLLVCPNCHANIHQKMGTTRGKGGKRQQMRRKRYKEGKTW